MEGCCNDLSLHALISTSFCLGEYRSAVFFFFCGGGGEGVEPSV